MDEASLVLFLHIYLRHTIHSTNTDCVEPMEINSQAGIWIEMGADDKIASGISIRMNYSTRIYIEINKSRPTDSNFDRNAHSGQNHT